ncbi:MAG: hypothetical protein GY859_34930 [Desulfobacterales bacterium]|nr:hypothetical protein [Desulfobacterales bacterium]
MKKLGAMFLLICVMAWTPTGASADYGKTKIAVLDFQLQGQGFETEDIGKIISEWLITALVKEGRFDVIERRLLNKVIKEQKLGVSGLVDENTASELGKVLGVEVIISGSVMKLQNFIEVNARIIDVMSASITAAESVKSTGAGRLEDLVRQMAGKIIQDFPLKGYVVNKNGDQIMIDLGRSAGVKRGMKFLVYKEGNVIKHPKTGEVLDVQQIETGVIEIHRVKKKISTGVVVSENFGGAVQYGHIVKSMVETPAPEIASSRAAPVSSAPVRVAPPVERGRLFIKTIPEDAKIRIMNIKPRYISGISLPDGNYRINVSAPGYITRDFWSRIQNGKDKSISVTLDPKMQPAVTEPARPKPRPAPPVVAVVQETVHPQKKGRRLVVFPPALRQDAWVLRSLIKSTIHGISDTLEAQSVRERGFEVDNQVNEKFDNSVWNNKTPDAEKVAQVAKRMNYDVVLMHCVYFRKGQGLANGWGVDLINPDIRTFVVDVHTNRVYSQKDRITNSRDQLIIELKRQSRILVGKYKNENRIE